MIIISNTIMKWMPYVPLFVCTVVVNAFLFLILIGFTSICLWLFIPSSLIYSIVSLISIGLYLFLFFIERRKGSPGLMAISLGGTVVPCMMLILVLVSLFVKTDESSHREPNKRQPLTSPSGKYVLTVPIERSKEERGPLGFGEPYRHVTISDPNGNILYCDLEKDFPGWFGTYWVWDEKDLVWIFGSDSGTFYYECTNDIWTRYGWRQDNKDNAEKDIEPPKSLYPSNYFEKNKNEIYLMLFLILPNHL